MNIALISKILDKYMYMELVIKNNYFMKDINILLFLKININNLF